MKLINKLEMGGMVGSLYQTSLRGRTYYVYKIRYNKTIVGRSYVYINGLDRASDMMKNEMEMLTGQMTFKGV
jgi:predicted transcriptional regulator